MTKQTQELTATDSAIRITWDAKPIRQQFGAKNIVCDGVASLSDGRTFRINVTASRSGADVDLTLRYLTEAKRGQAVPERQLLAVRAAAMDSAKAEMKAFRRAEWAAEDAARPSPEDCARRNAEAARQRALDPEGRAFPSDKPFRAFAVTPVSSTNWDFPTLAEARTYIAEQLARADGVMSGGAPAGPRYFDPMESFIVWGDGVETLADSPWNYRPDAGRPFGLPWTAVEAEAGPDGVAVGLTGPDWEPDAATRFFAARTNGPIAMGATVEAARAALEAAEAKKAAQPIRLAGTAPEAAAGAPAPVRLGNMGSNCPKCGLTEHGANGCRVRIIDATPSWAGVTGILIIGLRDGNAEGRRMAEEELRRMGGLADERNAMARALLALATVANETADSIGKPGTMARDEMDSAIAAAFALLNRESN